MVLVSLILALAGCGTPPPPVHLKTAPIPLRPDAVDSIAPPRGYPTGLRIPNGRGEFVEPELVKPGDAQLAEVRRHQELIQSGQEPMACLDVPATRCLASLSLITQVRMFTDPRVSLLGDTAPDLMGRPGLFPTLELAVTTNPSLTGAGKAEGLDYGVALDLSDDPGRGVKSIRIKILTGDISLGVARTDDDFDRSQVYGLFKLFLARGCPDLERKNLYKFLYTDVLNTANYRSVDESDLVGTTPGVICGYRVVNHIYTYKKNMTSRGRYEHEKKYWSNVVIVNYIEITQLGNKK